MTLKTWIEKWAAGEKIPAKKASMSIIDGNLYSYATLIAYKKENTIRLNAKKYSVTTSRQQNYIRHAAKVNCMFLFEYK